MSNKSGTMVQNTTTRDKPAFLAVNSCSPKYRSRKKNIKKGSSFVEIAEKLLNHTVKLTCLFIKLLNRNQSSQVRLIARYLNHISVFSPVSGNLLIKKFLKPKQIEVYWYLENVSQHPRLSDTGLADERKRIFS